MAPPSRTHQKLSMFFSSEISIYIKEKKGICEVYSAPFAVFLNKDETNYVEPDISVICDTDKLDEQGCHGAPDWIIEIVSPSNKSMDYLTKLFKYRAAGVREYWIVDPIKLMIIVYTFGKESMEEYSFGDKVPAGIFDDFTIKVE